VDDRALAIAGEDAGSEIGPSHCGIPSLMSTPSAPLDSAGIARIRASFARQGAMATRGAELAAIAAGRVAITLSVEPRLSQQDGFLHAGVVVAALDSACGYAALSMMTDDAEVLTVELKVNLLAPASGDSLIAEGQVVRAGRTLTVCRGDAYAEQGAERIHVATMLATMVRRRTWRSARLSLLLARQARAHRPRPPTLLRRR
jgi:uncharacterized protein (TIGR00369 family)